MIEMAIKYLVPIIIQIRNFPLFMGLGNISDNATGKIGTKVYQKLELLRR